MAKWKSEIRRKPESGAGKIKPISLTTCFSRVVWRREVKTTASAVYPKLPVIVKPAIGKPLKRLVRYSHTRSTHLKVGVNESADRIVGLVPVVYPKPSTF